MLTPSSVRLSWRDKETRPSSPYARLAPQHRGCDRTTLVHGDNLAALSALSRSAPAAASLVYLDPPFLTGRTHTATLRRRAPGGKIVRETRAGFDDRWSSLDDYLAALAPRIEAARALLGPDGCLILHVDPKTSHYAKVLCDEIFGIDCFASEIVWRYRRWPSKTPNFQRVHDVLLRYVRDPSARPRFNQLYEPLAPSTRATWGDRKQRAVVGHDGRRARSSKTADPSPGVPLGDVWEIGIVAPVARERTGYPTQKPEALMERLLRACSHEDDLIIDPYAGSGTTLAVAARLGRRSLGIDENAEAIATARRRLEAQGVVPTVATVAPIPRSARARRKAGASHAA